MPSPSNKPPAGQCTGRRCCLRQVAGLAPVGSPATTLSRRRPTPFSEPLRSSLHLASPNDDVVDDAVVPCFLGGEPAIAIGVGLDLVDVLARMVGDALGQQPPRVG